MAAARDIRLGTIELPIPRLRQGSCFPTWLLEPRRRAEPMAVVAESYVLDVSTRKIEDLVQTLGIVVSPSFLDTSGCYLLSISFGVRMSSAGWDRSASQRFEPVGPGREGEVSALEAMQPGGTAEERMVKEDVVREILARLARGEGVKPIAWELGLGPRTVKRWRPVRRRRHRAAPRRSCGRGSRRDSAARSPGAWRTWTFTTPAPS